MNNYSKRLLFWKTLFYANPFSKLYIYCTFISIFCATLAAHAQNKLTANYRDVPLSTFLKDLEKRSNVRFVYSDDLLKQNIRITVNSKDSEVEDILNKALVGEGIQVSQVNSTLFALYRTERTTVGIQQKEVNGKVVDSDGKGVPSVTFWVVGTRIGGTTNKDGSFRIIPPDEGTEIEFQYVGYVSRRVPIGDGTMRNIVLEREDNLIEEVVIQTGLFERKEGTFTGSTVSFDQKQIKEVSNQNVLSALAILDPSFQMLVNNDLGSNPNMIPDVQLRGQSGFSEDLRTQYSNAANQPLFVIDGFEATIQRVFDLNINFIKSVTILKDGAAKAMWGAKAGNGVIVIETLRPQVGQMRITYNASANIQTPDLTSYQLTNSMQKIEAEVLAGMYTATNPTDQTVLNKAYAQNRKAAVDGVDTYWLSQPLQNGVGQRHTMVFDGGEENFQYSVNLGYNNNKGGMKGSNRDTYTGQSILVYRKGKISATNNLTIERNFSLNSPYGSFSEYARMNPYWRIYDDNGNLIPAYDLFSSQAAVGNPLYNASLNSKDGSHYTGITQNFQLDYRHNNNLRFNARVGYNQQDSETEFFRSAKHTSYLNITPNSDQYLNRGEYRLSNAFQKAYTVDLTTAYNRRIGLHEFYFNGILTANEQVSELTGMTMVGFPNDEINSIGMGREYLPGSKAIGTENTVRTAALTTALNYAYDNRYLADVSYRRNGSSQFGRNTKWGNFYSFGLGWNIHQERFMKELGWMSLMRITANTGVTGTPPGTNAYQSLATYNYILDRAYNGDFGLDLIALPNPDLQWQTVRDNNVRLELRLFDRLNASFEYYMRNTNNLLLSMEIAPSLGFQDYAENIGDVRNEGYQATANFAVIKNPVKRLNVNIFGNLLHNTNVIHRISTSLALLNAANDALFDDETNFGNGKETQQRPVRRYAAGRSMDAIWGVRSLGIDPANGQEIFQKLDGSLTYEWNAADQVVLGENRPQYNGTFGANVQYKDFTVNFAFTYRWGGQMYNSTLVTAVDDANYAYNVDIRALEDRWQQPGNLASFKGIANRTTVASKPTSRFVQDLNELIFSSISTSYNFTRMGWVKRSPLKSLMFTCNLNDMAHLSTVRVERGLAYPFARTISFSLNASF